MDFAPSSTTAVGCPPRPPRPPRSAFRHPWHFRCAESRNLIAMSDSPKKKNGPALRSGSLGPSRKSSLGGSSIPKLSKHDQLETEAEIGPSSSTLDEGAKPDHLVVFVNGINGRLSNWEFASTLFNERLAGSVLVHCSTTNLSWKTFNGVDVMGNRLAQEVLEVIAKTPGLTKISFVAHSLGGLIARYAIGRLFAPAGERSRLEEDALASNTTDRETGGSGQDHNLTSSSTCEKPNIGGLEPINFVTLATPHLGSRDNRHLPFLVGVGILEWAAPHVSHWFVGKTGKHLFLADGPEPLLERMVTDCKEGRFLAALGAFQKRTAYANVRYDHMVGWRTASIRKQAEMPEMLSEGIDPRYPHIVREEEVSLVREEDVSASEAVAAVDEKEEAMVTGLQKVPWWRVDVNFAKAKVFLGGHYLIQVKTPSFFGEGEDVIRHVIDKHF